MTDDITEPDTNASPESQDLNAIGSRIRAEGARTHLVQWRRARGSGGIGVINFDRAVSTDVVRDIVRDSPFDLVDIDVISPRTEPEFVRLQVRYPEDEP